MLLNTLQVTAPNKELGLNQSAWLATPALEGCGGEEGPAGLNLAYSAPSHHLLYGPTLILLSLESGLLTNTISSGF